MSQDMESGTVRGNGGQVSATIFLYLKCDHIWTFPEGSNERSMESLN